MLTHVDALTTYALSMGLLVVFLLVWLGGIWADLADFSLQHAVFLKWISRQLDPGALFGQHKTCILVGDPYLGLDRVILGHDRHQYRAGHAYAGHAYAGRDYRQHHLLL